MFPLIDKISCCFYHFTLNRPGFLQMGMAEEGGGGGQANFAPLPSSVISV